MLIIMVEISHFMRMQKVGTLRSPRKDVVTTTYTYLIILHHQIPMLTFGSKDSTRWYKLIISLQI
ncbi:hypothetical protein D3C73_483910 [compost metagenome]